MTPEQIRAMYASEDAATSAEARATQAELRTDPDMARQLLLSLYALGGEDAFFAQLLGLIIRVGSMQLIAIKAAEDDDFALRMAELILEGMESISKVQRVERGRDRKVKSA